MKKFRITFLNASLLLLLVIFFIGILMLYNNLDFFWRQLYPLKYQNLVFKYAQFYDNDPYLVTAIIYRESRFNPNAVSNKGAIGLMQIMPETAEWIAENLNLNNFDVDDLYIPETNIKFGNWYLDNLFNEFDGNLVLVLAAYNGGRGNVNKWIKEGKFRGEVQEIDLIPFPETRKFVSNVLSLYQRYLQLYNNDN